MAGVQVGKCLIYRTSMCVGTVAAEINENLYSNLTVFEKLIFEARLWLYNSCEMAVKTCDVEPTRMPLLTTLILISSSLLIQASLLIFTIHHYQKQEKYGAIGRLCITLQIAGICFTSHRCIFQFTVTLARQFPPIIICQTLSFGVGAFLGIFYGEFSFARTRVRALRTYGPHPTVARARASGNSISSFSTQC